MKINDFDKFYMFLIVESYNYDSDLMMISKNSNLLRTKEIVRILKCTFSMQKPAFERQNYYKILGVSVNAD